MEEQPDDTDNITDIEDIDSNFSGGFGSNKSGFDKPLLVFEAVRNCLTARNCEMRAGYVNRKSDKLGNVSEIYIEDGRKKFISCVEVLGEILSPDFDEEAEDNTSELLDSIDEKEKEFIIKEELTWKSMSADQRKQLETGRNAVHPISGFIVLPFYQEVMTEFQLKVFKMMFTELNHLLNRIKYFKKKVKFG